ncbi:MAG: hypothetical protein KDI30_07345 [Pseudomonadales bacterium]|nr:hypothetical protein [Pseudomonadales bacterium]
MNDEQNSFLAKREKLTRQWKWAGSVLLGWSVLLYGYLFFFSPLLANPFYVIERIKEGDMERSTLELMAVLLPVVTGTLFLVLLVFILLSFVIFKNEKKYQEIIAAMRIADQ